MNITRIAIPAALLAAAGAVAASAPALAETPDNLRETTSNSASLRSAAAQRQQTQEASLTFVSGSIDFGYEDIDVLTPVGAKNDTLTGSSVGGKTFKPRPFQEGQDWEANSIFMDESYGYTETTLTGLEIEVDPKTGKAMVTSGFLANAGASAYLNWHPYMFSGETQLLDLSGLPATIDADGSVTVSGTATPNSGMPYSVTLQFKLNKF